MSRYKENCKHCNKEFTTYSNKFCSRECYFKNKIGSTRTELHKMNNKNALLQYYKTDDWKLKKEERAKKIGNSNTKHLSNEQLEELKVFLNEKYVYNKRILAKKISPDISYKVINNTFNLYPELLELYKQTLSFIPLRIQEYSIGEWLKLKEDFNKKNITEFCEEYKINVKTHRRLRDFYGILIPRKYQRKLESKPEKFIKTILEELKIEYKQEQSINNKYIIDFVIGNIAIEVQGDYWHGNPKLYSEDNYNSQQIRNIFRDKLKHDMIISSGMFLIELWENDIYKKPNKIKQLFNIIKNGKYNRTIYTSLSWR